MDEGDAVLARAVESLRQLPDVRPESMARLLIAVSAERQREREARVNHVWRKRNWLVGAGLTAAAVVVAVLSLLPNARRSDTAAAVEVSQTARQSVTAVPVSRKADVESSARSVQLVLSAAGARSVRVVGDFNGWDDRRSPMVRDEASGLWNVTVMVQPGRHVYAFVVNDTQWVRDPRAAAAPDVDFGRPGSVMLVGRP